MTAYIQLENFIRAAQVGADPTSSHYLFSDDQGCVKAVDSTTFQPDSAAAFSELNKKTWKAFEKSLHGTLGEERTFGICSRYRYNLAKKVQSGNPLLSEDVELFSVGASRIKTDILKNQFPGKLKDVPVAEITQRLKIVNPFPIIGETVSPKRIGGAPSQFSALFFHNALLMDKESQILFSDTANLSFPAWKERFAKCLVNRELEEKQIIPAPGEGKVEYYKVYRKIATGHGLVAYALKPTGSDSSLKPLLFFRPTQFAPSGEDALESYLNDLQPNLGELGYSHAKPFLDYLMKDPKFCPPGSKISIAGYSLGGAHAQRFLADNWKSVSQIDSYNAPSVEQDLADKFAQEVNAETLVGQPLLMNIYRAEGDITHLFGEKHLGHGVSNENVAIQLIRVNHDNRKLSALAYHSRRLLDSPFEGYQATYVDDRELLNKHLDNNQLELDVFWYEKTRRVWGSILYTVGSFFLPFFKMMFSFLGIFRSSQDNISLGSELPKSSLPFEENR